MNQNNCIRNRVITIIIYLLSLYVMFLMFRPFFSEILKSDNIYYVMKYIVDNNSPAISYRINANNQNGNDILTFETVLNKMLDTPAMRYANDIQTEAVSENISKSYFTSEYLSKEYIEKNHFYMDGDENTNEGVNDQNEQVAQQNLEQETETTQVLQEINNDEVVNTEFGIKKIIPIEQLTYDFLIKNFYTIVSSTTLNPQDIDANELMNIDLKMNHGNDVPQILIYHTHGQEMFVDSDINNRDTGIVGIGNYLTQLLTEKYGYNVIHLTDSFDNVNGVLNRHKAYDYAYDRVSQVLADNPSIEVVLDLHRDGVSDNLHLVTNINGKQTAKIMFFNGISRLNSIGEIGYLFNPYRKENLAMSLQMKVLAEEYFEGYTRKTYIQAYQYNLHMRAKSMLIEVGAQTNTFEEAKNAMEPLAFLLDQKLHQGQ